MRDQWNRRDVIKAGALGAGVLGAGRAAWGQTPRAGGSLVVTSHQDVAIAADAVQTVELGR